MAIAGVAFERGDVFARRCTFALAGARFRSAIVFGLAPHVRRRCTRPCSKNQFPGKPVLSVPRSVVV